MNYEWTCSVCGAAHEGLPFSWGFDEPAYWGSLDDKRREHGYLDSDTCWFRDDAGNPAFFVRGTIEIPILDGRTEDEEWFVIGPWASLSETNHGWLLDHWTAGPEEQGEPWFGWLSNEIPVYPDTLNLKTHVHLRGEGLRPLIEVEPGKHPLAKDLHDGITLERARQLSEQWLHA